jgi:hypothetical protein
MSASNGVAIGPDGGRGGGCGSCGCGGGLNRDGPGVGVGGVSGRPGRPTRGDPSKAASSPKNLLPDRVSSVSESARNGSLTSNEGEGGGSGEGDCEEGTTSSLGVVTSCGAGCDRVLPCPRLLCPRCPALGAARPLLGTARSSRLS